MALDFCADAWNTARTSRPPRTTLTPASDGPDKGLATELAYGYLRLRGRMDFLLNRSEILSRPRPSCAALGVAAYELLFLSRIPDYATLDWAVGLVKERLDPNHGHRQRCVPGSWSAWAARVHQPDYQTRIAGHAAFLAAWYSCPQWLVQMDQGLWSGSDRSLFTGQPPGPALGVRINRQHPKVGALRAELSPWPWRPPVRDWR